jgi:hypothetical protein
MTERLAMIRNAGIRIEFPEIVVPEPWWRNTSMFDEQV